MAPVLAARNAVVMAFVLNGFLFASLVSRIPDLRDGLSLDNGALGFLLLSIAVGSILGLPSAGALIHRWSAGAVVRSGCGGGGGVPAPWAWCLSVLPACSHSAWAPASGTSR